MRMALLCFLGVIISGLAHSADTEPKEVFENYRKAILEAKGASAAECVSEQTIAYYQAMLDHALKSNQETVQAMMLLDRLMV